MLTVPSLSVYEVGGPSTVAAEGPSFPLLAHGLPIPPVVIEDLSTRLGNLDYGFEDRQSGEHTDAVYFGIGEADCSIREKTPMTPVVLLAFYFDFWIWL
ncbi:hypothetical protein Tco_0723894 [Tanacetum coccineum]